MNSSIHRCLTSLLVLVLVSTVSCVDQQTSSTGASEDSLLILGVSIIDPASNSVSESQDILLQDGLIAEVAAHGAIEVDRAARVIRAEGMFALPGLIDVHAHLGDGGLGVLSQQDREGALAQFVRYGVTSIFAPGGGGANDDKLARWKQRCAAKELICPGLFGSGALITAPGSHPISTIWNFPEDVDAAIVYERGAVAVAEDEPVAPLLDRKRDLGVDAIKIIIEDGPGPWVPKPRLSRRKIAELVLASHERGLRIFAHVSMPEHVQDAVAAGVDGVMHSCEDPIPDAVFAEMAERGMYYVATLALYDGFYHHSLGQFEQEPYALAGVSRRALLSLEDEGWRNRPNDPPEMAEVLREAIFDNLRRALRAGVPIALGTDVDNPTVFPGYSAHEELALMVQAGLTPAEALHAATAGSASFLEREATLGKIAPGYEADLLILAKNPLENILHTRTVVAVVHDGRLAEQIVSTEPSAALLGNPSVSGR